MDKKADSQRIVKLFKQSEYKAFKVDLDVIAEALEYADNEIKQGREIDNQTTFVVAEREDAQLSINVSADKLTAKAQIITGLCG